jgi:hypothetical protein
MAIFKAQVAAAADSVLPRDRLINTIHFDRPLGLPNDPDVVATDIANLFSTSWYGLTRQITVRLYEVGGPPPHFPFGQATLRTGLAPVTPGPREVAVCLSYYATRNLPRQRGRLFLAAVSGGADTSQGRPNTGARDRVIALGQGISAIGGADIDWGVYSPTEQQFRRVTNIWCDDEWDTVRSRGLRSTTRTQATTSG